ncbi:MAG: DUF2723 domain-containing protein [Candidatus Wallbacteria bacterium]|nr:DUF2723 domain-containing protein [Candidatus Wallbacteria bacterium]
MPPPPSKLRLAKPASTAAPPLEARDFAIAAGLGLAALAIYLLTVCRTIYWGDSSEFAVVCPMLDITHPTGYPFFTLLGKLFTLLPIGTIAFRVNLLGTVPAAVCVGLLFLVARQAGLTAGSAAFGAGLMAVSKELWDQGTACEVYSLHAALTAACLLAALTFWKGPSARRLAMTAGMLGLSFTNHLTTLWNVPALAWLVLCDWQPWRSGGAWQPSRRELARAAAAFGAMLLLYAYVPIRASQGVLFNHGEPGTVGSFLYHLTGRQFQYRMFTDPEAGIAKEVGEFWERFQLQFTPWLLPLVAIGAVALAMRSRSLAIAMALLVAVNLVFDLNYHIPDKDGYFLGVYLACALCAAEGLAALATMAGRGRPPGQRAVATAVAGLLLLAAPAVVNRPLVDKSSNRSLPEFTEELFKRLPPGGLLMVDDQFLIWSAAYVQLLERRYVDRMVVNDYLLCLPWYVHHLRRRYPQLVLPSSVDELVGERGAEVAKAKGWKIGDISQRYIERIARAIVEANLKQRRVFWNWHDSEERKEWKGLPVTNRGLFYEVLKAAPATQEPWSIDYPDPANYHKTELVDAHHRHVADTFSVACNRAGIALIAAGRYAEAEAAFNRSLEYNRDYPQVHLNMGVLFHTYAPNRAKRDEHWKKFLELAPNDPQAATVKKEIGG